MNGRGVYRPSYRTNAVTRAVRLSTGGGGLSNEFHTHFALTRGRTHSASRQPGQTKLIEGVGAVEARVVHDQAFENDDSSKKYVLVEDWHAQDSAGNVWYFGEDTKELDADGTSSARKAPGRREWTARRQASSCWQTRRWAFATTRNFAATWQRTRQR